MGEIIKRVVIILGLFILFVFCFLLINVGSQYGEGVTTDSVLVSIGLKKVVAPTPAARPVESIEAPTGELERIGHEPSPTPLANLDDGVLTVDDSPTPAPSPVQENNTDYYPSGTHQAPLNTF